MIITLLIIGATLIGPFREVISKVISPVIRNYEVLWTSKYWDLIFQSGKEPQVLKAGLYSFEV